MGKDTKVLDKIRKFGGYMSGMVMPNLGAFVGWGLLAALFIPTGWMPNEGLSKLVGPMITYLLPLLIGYSGGKLVAGERGGVVGAIATSGVIIGTSIPMFMGAMIAGPIGGWLIKKFDEAVDGKVKGNLTETTIPAFDVKIASNNASFQYPDLPKSVKNIVIDTHIINETGLMNDTFVNLHQLSFAIDQDVFNCYNTFVR